MTHSQLMSKAAEIAGLSSGITTVAAGKKKTKTSLPPVTQAQINAFEKLRQTGVKKVAEFARLLKVTPREVIRIRGKAAYVAYELESSQTPKEDVAITEKTQNLTIYKRVLGPFAEKHGIDLARAKPTLHSDGDQPMLVITF